MGWATVSIDLCKRWAADRIDSETATTRGVGGGAEVGEQLSQTPHWLTHKTQVWAYHR